MVKKSTPVTGVAALATSVALPASTGSGLASEASVVDALKLGENQNNDAPGDLAADLVTRPVIATGAVFEPANSGLGPQPALDGNQAGDTAIAHVAGVDPIVTLNTEEGSAAGVVLNAVPLDATLTETQFADPSAMEPVEEPVDIVVFDLGQPATDEDRINLQLVLDHVQASFPGFTLPGDARPAFAEPPIVSDFPTIGGDVVWRDPVTLWDHAMLDREIESGARFIQVTSKRPGFRRAGIAHPSERVEYRINVFTRDELLDLLNEPMLVTELN